MVSSPTTIFFLLFGLILILSSPLLLSPFLSAACATLFQLMFWLRSVCVPVLLWGLITASQALGWGCWAELWLDVGIAACLDFPVCHPCIVLCVPFDCSCWLWGGWFWRRECQAPSTLQHSGNGGWTSGQQRRKGGQRVFRRILCWPIWPAQLSGRSPAAHWLSWHFLFGLCTSSTVPVQCLCQVHWTAQLGCVACLSAPGGSGSSAGGGRGRGVKCTALPSTVPSALAEPPSTNSSGRRWCRIPKSCLGNEGMSAGAS